MIYRKEKVPKIGTCGPNCGETERSVALANLLSGRGGTHVAQIDLDFNTDPAHPSNKVLSASAGYIQSLGLPKWGETGVA